MPTITPASPVSPAKVGSLTESVRRLEQDRRLQDQVKKANRRQGDEHASLITALQAQQAALAARLDAAEQEARTMAAAQHEALRREGALRAELAEALAQASGVQAQLAAVMQNVERMEEAGREAALAKQEIGVLRMEQNQLQQTQREADARAIEDAGRLSALEQAQAGAEQRLAALTASAAAERTALERSVRCVREELKDALALAQTEMQEALKSATSAVSRFEAAREVQQRADHGELLTRLEALHERADESKSRAEAERARCQAHQEQELARLQEQREQARREERWEEKREEKREERRREERREEERRAELARLQAEIDEVRATVHGWGSAFAVAGRVDFSESTDGWLPASPGYPQPSEAGLPSAPRPTPSASRGTRFRSPPKHATRSPSTSPSDSPPGSPSLSPLPSAATRSATDAQLARGVRAAARLRERAGTCAGLHPHALQGYATERAAGARAPTRVVNPCDGLLASWQTGAGVATRLPQQSSALLRTPAGRGL